ncbi:MAG TPA: type II toxin-antitoxin system HicB family antitoxin [Rhizomicrobium sp.]
MVARIYPAILEGAEKKTFAVWLPDLPDCVAVGRTQEEAIEKAQDALAVVIETFAEREHALPPPTPIADIERPKNFLAFVMLTAAPPDPSERVNVYLPKSLIARADKRAAELGMSRSSFFGYAISVSLTLMAKGALLAMPGALKTTPLPPIRKTKSR